MFYSILQAMITKISSSDTTYSLKRLLCQADIDGNTPIHFAAYRGNIQIIAELIKQGCDYTVKNNTGLTVMHMAAQGDRPNVLLYFKEKYHMNINQKDINGSTPLHWACYTSSENAINFLLSWIDDVNITDNKGQTPLHIAIFSDRINIIKKLLHKGSDTSIRDNSNRTVYDIASQNSNLSNIFRLLVDYKPTKTCCYQSDDSMIAKSYLFSILSVSNELLTFFVLVPYLNSYFVSSLYIIAGITFLISYFYMTTSDPGILISNYYVSWLEIVERKIDINALCPYCKVQKASHVKHCHCCGHCVEYFDHHCHWINNCIGEKNSVPFMFFLCVLIFNLAFNYVIALKAFLINDNGVFVDEEPIIIFGFVYFRRIKDILSLFIMCVSLFFIIPVIYVLYNQFKNRSERSLRKSKETSYL